MIRFLTAVQIPESFLSLSHLSLIFGGRDGT
ncbi:hypothetical protein C7450_12275 [Chelatococcus asaccharovorans]|uniref:Uncharacterized protein n=1 Tax=Chelatococcus asaccharovorans TaxID=28210 RepID=A0A2V3TSE0_9HYPH|nr:hypothetical protein C7450_12275 [Chelatococcus asaccharovorans]